MAENQSEQCEYRMDCPAQPSNLYPVSRIHVATEVHGINQILQVRSVSTPPEVLSESLPSLPPHALHNDPAAAVLCAPEGTTREEDPLQLWGAGVR